MLEGLDRVDWSKWEHAYGPADDLPDLLRSLASDDRGRRAEALHALFGNIYHQGSRYPATAKAVPFLVELIEAAAPRDAEPLLGLLTCCVAGFFSPTTGPHNSTGPAWKPAPRTQDHALYEEIDGAAAQAIPAALRLLECAHARTRVGAAWLLACFRTQEAAHQLSARLRARLSRESNPLARGAIAFALGEVVPLGEDGALLEIFRDDPSPLARLISALLIARRQGAATPAEVVDALCRALDADRRLAAEYERLPWQTEGMAGDVAAVVASVGPEAASRILPALQARLARVRTFDAVHLVEAALIAAFGQAKAPPSAGDLSLAQRELLVALVHNVAFWTLGNALNVLSERGLPSARSTMAEYLGVTPRYDPVEEAKAAARACEGFGQEQSYEAWSRVLDLAPDDAEALAAAGELLVEESDQLDKALTLLDKAVERDAANGRAHFFRGCVLEQLGRDEEALEAFTRAEALVDDPRPARQNRIGMLQRLGRVEEAAELDAAEDPDAADDPAEAWYNRGLAAVKAGRYDASVEAVSKSIELRPDHAYGYYTIACAYCLRAKEGDADRALENISRAIKLDSDVAEEIAQDPDFESIRSDERFQKLIAR